MKKFAWEYAGQFGEFSGKIFEEKRWSCTETALKELKKRFDNKGGF